MIDVKSAQIAPISRQRNPNELGRPSRLRRMAFWTVAALAFLLSRVLIVATGGLFRLGLVTLILGLLVLVRDLLKTAGVRINTLVAALTLVLCGEIVVSGLVNGSPLLALVAFIRIPISAFLLYYLASSYLREGGHERTLLRNLCLISLAQLPLVAVQRTTYPYLPDFIKQAGTGGQLTLTDFGTGTFYGDAAMSFFCIALLGILLFYPGSQRIVRFRWPLAFWLTATVLVANSQIQHFSVALVWGAYVVRRISLQALSRLVILVIVLGALLPALHQEGIVNLSPIAHTIARASAILRPPDEASFQSYYAGGHAREAALYLYLHTPIKWLGDGPGRYLDTITRTRALGNWGHIYTFYDEIGLAGLLLSILVFAAVAFPVTVGHAQVRISVSWYQLVLFMGLGILLFARYPMNDTPIYFTYCLALGLYQQLAQPVHLVWPLSPTRAIPWPEPSAIR